LYNLAAFYFYLGRKAGDFKIFKICFGHNSVPHHFNVYPDPFFHLNADKDPTFPLNPDPDPAPHQSGENLLPLAYRPTTPPL
jgi:hypothetical protein